MILLLLLIPVLPLASGSDTYFIKPIDHGSRPCPGNPCRFLSDYAENGMQYFPSNVVMVFLPGIHIIDQCLSVRDVTSVVLISANVTVEDFNPSVKITCSNYIHNPIFVL